MTWTTKLWIVLALILIAFGLGLGTGWKLYRTKSLPATVIQPEPQIIMKDGSVVVKRIYVPSALPLMQVPQGDHVEEQGTVTAQSPSPVAPPATTGSGLAAAPPLLTSHCPPVKISWAVLTEPDGGKRVQFKADEGTILDGEDVVLRPPAPIAAPPRWAVGGSRYFREKTYGLWLERRLGPFLLAGEVKQERAEFGSGRLSVDSAIRFGVQF